MEQAGLVELVKYNLGWPTINVHTDDKVFEAQVARALRYYSRYCPKINVKTIVPTRKLDMSAERPRGIIKIYSVRSLDNSTDLPIDAFMPYVQSTFRYSGGLVGFFAKIQQLESITEFMRITEWELVGNELLLSYPGGTSVVTVYYYTDWAGVVELDDRGVQWVTDYTTALVKQIEGRILRKYRVQDIDTDGESLVSEGKDEQTRLEEEVQQLMPMLLGGKI